MARQCLRTTAPRAGCRTEYDPSLSPIQTCRAYVPSSQRKRAALHPAMPRSACRESAAPGDAIGWNRPCGGAGCKRHDGIFEFCRKKFPASVRFQAQHVATWPPRLAVLKHVGRVDAPHDAGRRLGEKAHIGSHGVIGPASIAGQSEWIRQGPPGNWLGGDHLLQAPPLATVASLDLKGAILVGEILWCVSQRSFLKVIRIRKRKWRRGRGLRCSLALPSGRGQRIQRIRVEGVLESAIHRLHAGDLLEGAGVIRFPDVNLGRGEAAGQPEGDSLRVLCIDRLHDHAPILSIGGTKSHATSLFRQVYRSGVEVLPSRLSELRGMGRGPDGSLNVVMPGPWSVCVHEPRVWGSQIVIVGSYGAPYLRGCE